MTNNRYLCQFLADVTGLEVILPVVSEMTGFGTTRFAMLGARVAATPEKLPSTPEPRTCFAPQQDLANAQERFADAVEHARRWR